ncbi:MAG TPA: fibro-slime domain-containing protein [Polyangia bacterium]|nr:fibro-slime domain-containing protein [Polyangia bacterium]
MRRGLTIALGFALAGCGAPSGLKPADDAAASATDASDAPPYSPPMIPDDGYTMTESGGYKLGPAVSAAELATTNGAVQATAPSVCGKLRGVVRDFKGALPAYMGTLQPGGHPDFEVFEGRGITTGLVAPEFPIAVDGGVPAPRKPIYTGACELGKVTANPMGPCPFGAMTTTAANFNQWYTSDDAVNQTYLVYFDLVPNGQGNFVFSSNKFFPLDGAGWGNSGFDQNGTTPRNYSFTTEIHAKFKYNSGQTFTFHGDDDVWIFINGKLAVDLGGLHEDTMGSVNLDAQAAALGITPGNVYTLDLFNAERHSYNSDFSIELNFQFQDCGYIVP